MHKFKAIAATLLTIINLSPVFAQEAAAPTLPGGATTLQETYEDWRVGCAIQNRLKVCAISQSQAQQNGQRILAIELHNGADGAVTGALVLPFGLLFDAGVTLQIDDNLAQKPLRFRTCLSAGCIVPIVFDQKTIAILRTGTVLKLQVKAEDGRELGLSISLNGLAAAFDRLNTLAKG